MYVYSNKEILFEKCPVQFPICLSNIQYYIYFLLMFRSQEAGTLEIPTIHYLVESVLETGTLFKSH